MGDITEAGEDMEKSEDIASVTKCIPVDCVAKACCTLSLLLDIDVSSSMAGPDLRPIFDAEYVGWRAAGGVRLTDGRAASSEGNGDELMLERISKEHP